METRPLGELIAPASTRRAGSSDLPILSMTMHGGLVDQTSKFKKRVASADTSDYKVVRRGQLVVGFPIDEGVLDFQSAYDEAIVSPAYGIWDVRDEALHRPYLSRFLRSPMALAYYKGKLRGTTARRRSLPAEVFLELSVPLPSNDEQRRIADILDRAAGLRTLRRRALIELESFVYALFVDMFGDPLTNPRSFSVASLKDLGRVVTGRTPPSSVENAFGGAIPFLTPGDLGSGRPPLRTLSESGASKSVLVRSGSALVCCIGATIGKVGQASVRSAFNQQINAVEWGPEITDAYGWACLKAHSDVIARQGTSTTMPILNKSSFERLEIPVPPRDLQDQFTNQMATCQASTTAARRHLSVLDSLTTSLQHRAFRGEL
jgi:type I restriction enzyme S subunit